MKSLTLDRRGTVEQLASALEERILDGQLLPGTRLKESRLASELELSRNSVREAIRGLVSTGLVRHRPHRGFVVTELSVDDILDLYRVRTTLEISAVRAPFAALQARVPRLEDAVERLLEAQRQADWGGLFRAHRRFHAELVGALSSGRLEHFLRQVFGELRLAMSQVERGRPVAEQPRDEHQVLIDRICAGDRRGLVSEMRLHLERGEQRVLDRLNEDESSDQGGNRK